MKTITTLPPGFLNQYLRSQSVEVKQNAYRALGVFSFAGSKLTQVNLTPDEKSPINSLSNL
jgi:hypothetical protein